MFQLHISVIFFIFIQENYSYKILLLLLFFPKNFYKNEINRQEMYIRYIYKLHDLHVPAGNFTEAAFTLQLHANQLSWTQRMLHADHLYPAQTETQRKELIYMKIINYFDKGKVLSLTIVFEFFFIKEGLFWLLLLFCRCGNIE